MSRSPDHDVIVIGDGPAACVLGAACVDRGLDVVRVGPATPWPATYGTFVDQTGDLRATLAAESPIDVVTTGRQRLPRRYGVYDNVALRARLDRAPTFDASVVSVRHHAWGAAVHTADGQPVRGRVVIDASGAASPFVNHPRSTGAMQRAYGLVLDHRPVAIGGDVSVMMDWRPPVDGQVPTFLYVVALPAGRWLVEETSLARSPEMSFDELRTRLAARLGTDLTPRAEHVELVSIPMVPGVPDRAQPTVGFGAAAGFVHPATGYSLAASFGAAPRVAAAVAAALEFDDPLQRSRMVWESVWPTAQRRSRALHDYGLEALLRLSAADVAQFFAAFFAMPVEQWSAYLRLDAAPAEVRRVMTAVFSEVPWAVRRTLARGNPLALARLVH